MRLLSTALSGKQFAEKSKYYLQIVLKEKPPIKYNEKTGELKHPIGEGRVGIDVGLQTLAAVCENEVKLVPLASLVRTKRH